MIRHTLTALVLANALLALAGPPSRALALDGRNEHVNAHYLLPPEPEGGYYNLDVYFKPVVNPVRNGSVWPAFFYANSFRFNADEGRSGCAYMGLQTDREGKRAIFSIWGGIAASSSMPGAIVEEFTEVSCADYTGGWHIFVPLPWTTHTYRYRVWRLETTAAGTEYGAWIMDTDTGDETMIGTIMVPNTWGGMSSDVVLFSEWYGGEFPSCRSMPRSNVLFGIPTADAGDATATFTGQVDVGGACPGTFTDWGTGIQEMLPR